MAKNNLHTKKVTAALPQLRSPQSVDMSLFNSQMSRLNSVKAQSGISKSAQNIINAMASNVQKSENNARSIINAAKKKEKKLEADLAKYRVLENNAETDKSANQQLLEKRLSGENLFPVKKSASSETEKPKSELSDVSRQLFTADELNGTATVGIKDVNNLTDNDFQILRSRAQQRLATEIRRSSKKQDKTKIDALKSFISNIPAAGTEPTTAQSTPQNKSVNTVLGNIQNRNTFRKTSSSEPVNTVLGNVQNRNTFPKQSNSTPVNTVLGNVQNRNTFPKTGDSIQEKIYKKYNINTDTFNNQDLSKWENDTGAFKDVADDIKNKSGASQRFALMKTLFTGKTGEKGISDSTLRNEYRVLKAVADNNDRKNNLEQSYSDNSVAKKATGNVRSAWQSMSNAATFGLTNRLSDAVDEENFKRTGLSKDKLTKTTDVIKNNYGVAESVGNVAGDLFSLMASEAVVKGAVSAVKGVKGAITGAKGLNTAASFKNVSAATKAPIKYALEKAAESGAIYGLHSFARNAIETGDLKQAAKSGAVEGVSGAAGEGVAAYVGPKLINLAATYSEKAIAKKLAKNVGRPLDKTDFSDLSEVKHYVDALYKNYGLKEYFYPRILANFATSGAFVASSTGARIGMSKMLYDNYNPTAKDTAKSIAEQMLVAFGFSTLHLFSEYGKLSAQNKTVVKDTVSQMEQCVNTMNDLKNSGNVSSQEYNALENAFKQRVKVMQNIVNSGEMVGSAKEQRELRNTLKMLNDYGEALKVIKDNGSYKILERDKPEEQPKTEKPSAVNVKYRDAANAEADIFSEAANRNNEVGNVTQTSVPQPFARRSGGRNIQFETGGEPIIQPVEQTTEPQPYTRRMSRQPEQNTLNDEQDFYPTPENAVVNDEQDFYPTPENSADVSNVRVPSAASENIPTAQINNSVPTSNVADVLPIENIPADKPINSTLERMFNERRAKDEAVIPPRQTISTADISNDIKNQLMNGVNTISEITRNIGANIGQVNSTLFSMELNGEVKRKAGNTYELTDTAAKNNQTDMIKPVSVDNSITSHKDNIASNDSNDILHTVENTIYPQFKENAVGLFEKEYGGNGFSGFADRLIENYKSDGDIGKGERAFFADNGESVTKLIADAVKNERGGGENISDRTFDSVGSRNVKAFQYTYPQLKKYYSGIANELLGDIKSTVKGEKTPIFAEDGNISGYTGTPRQTSSSIERIKDATGASYDKISDALNRIISDNGQENVALAKRIELVMDDMLSDGYTAFDGTKIPPNESYVAEKGEIEWYNDTAHKKSNLTAVENTNPISTTSETTDNAVSVDSDLLQNKSFVNNNSTQKSENNVADLSFKLKNSYHLLEKEPDLFEINKDVVSEQPGKNITEKVYNYFKSIGGEADNPTLGKVEFTKSGAKSTVFHGVGHDKIRAVAAVKPVIENGVIVSKDTDWKNRGYDTYIIAGKGNIDNKKSIVGVIVKAYPDENNKGNKFYLHELIKIGADSDAVAKNSQTNVIESTPIDSDIISQKDGAVNNNSMQKSEKNSDVSPENILKMLSRGEKTSLEDVKSAVNSICNNEADIKAELSKFTNAELKQKMNIVDRGRYSKKADMVNAIYNDMLSRAYYTISGKNTMSMTMFDGKSFTEQTKDLVNAELNSLTEERLKALTEKYSEEYKKRVAEREERKKSIENPQTLDDYLRKKRTVGLSESENSDFERLYAITRKERRTADRASVSSSKTAVADDFLKNNDNFTVEESTHSKTGEKIWVVKPKERLATDEWKNINSSMKSLGGFYWKGNGGWNFKKNPIVESEPEISAVQGSSSEKLRTIADNMQKSIDECFKDRLTNTAKRAREAASATDKGEKLQRTQATIRNIADGIESGNIKLLTDIDSKAQVDTLFHMLTIAQNNRIKAIDGITYSERLQEQEKPYGNDDIKYAKLPLDTVYSGIVEEYAKAADGKAGYKMIHSRLEKAVKGVKDNYVHITPQLFDDISKVVKNLDTTRDDYWNDGVSELNRLKRMGIESNVELRAYLREFVENIPGVDAEAEQKKAIRQKEIELANSKIDGFFPTPKNIVEKMLDEADIKKGEIVLEPSAGKGNIADEIRTRYPDNALEVAEINGSLAELLKEKGHNVVGNDFLATNKKYDKIIMNPPFEKLQDIDHVKHAYDMLNPGGRLVAIMSESPFFNSAKKAEVFRTWLEDVGGVSEKLPENSFKNSERSTGVNTRMVVIDKGAETLSGKSNPNEKYSLDNHSDNSEWWSGASDNTESHSIKSPRDISKYISETFNIPISTGNIGKGNASGVYKMPSQTIRTRITNDLPVISHELGHMLDDKYGLSNAKHINEVLNYAYKLDPDFIDQYSGEEQDGEAIGQFVKSYLINPQKAKSGAAQFYKEFAEALSKEDMNALNQASKFIREYISADFMDKVSANIVSKKDLHERTPVSDKAKSFYTKLIDDMFPVKEAVDFVEKAVGKQAGSKNAYTLAMNSKNAASISAFILREGMTDKNGDIVGKSFIDCLSGISEKQLGLFSNYLVLKHSLDWLSPTDGSAAKRVFADEALQDVDEIKKQIANAEKRFPNFKEAAKNIYEYQNNLMKYWCVDMGGMSESLFKALQKRYPHYVPFYRAVNKKGGIKRTFANQRTPINRAKGSGEAIINVLESIMYNTEKFVKFGTRNRVMQNLADYADNVKGFGNFMEKVPPNKIPHVVDISAKIDKLKDVMSGLNDSDFGSLSEALDDVFGESITSYTPVAIAGKQIVTVLRNGKFEYYQIHDKALFDAVANMTPKQMSGFVKLSRKILMPTNLLITQFNYLFGAKNVLRDYQTGYKHTKAYNNIADYTVGYFKALGHILQNSPEYKEYKAAGNGHMSNFSDCVDQLQKALRDVASKDKGKAARLAYSIFNHPIETLVSLNEVMETVPRLSEFEGLRKKGTDVQEATLGAADITVNFNRSGEAGRTLNGVFRFSNAANQGIDKEIRTFMTGGKKSIFKYAMRYLLSALFTTALISAWNRKDKDSKKAWDNLANYQKNNFYCISTGDGEFVKIPKAREVSILNTLAERIIDECFGNKDAFYQFGEYLGNTILPGYIPTSLDAKEALHDILGETALSGVADVAFNEDFKGSPIVSRSLENEAPKNQYNNKTSWLAYELGQLMNISPMKADHIIDNYGGVFGKINRSIGAKDSKQIDKSLGFKNTFITDSTYSTDTFNYMYDRRDKAEEKFKNDPTPENAALYQSYATGCSLITNSRKLIYDMPEDKQKAAQNKLIDTVKQYRKEHSKGDALIAKSFGKGLRYDSKGTDLPDNEISYKSNGKTVKQGLTFDQYMTFVKDYMNIADTKQKEVIRTDEYKKSDYDTKQKKLSKARSEAKKKAVQNIMSKIKE